MLARFSNQSLVMVSISNVVDVILRERLPLVMICPSPPPGAWLPQSSVGVRSCLTASCTRRPCLNVFGSKKGVYCKQHAEKNSMVDVVNKRCSHECCRRVPNYNLHGVKRAVHRKYAKLGMANVLSRCCMHDSSTSRPSFSVEASSRQMAASSMLRKAWWTSARGVARRNPARIHRASMSMAARRHCTARNMLVTA